MNAEDLIFTSLVLGGFVATGGVYGIAFSCAKATRRHYLYRLAYAGYGLQCLFTIALLVLTPLDWWWKLLVLASCIAYYFVPPATWRYLIALHAFSEESVP